MTPAPPEVLHPLAAQGLRDVRRLLTQHSESVGISGAVGREGGIALEVAGRILFWLDYGPRVAGYALPPPSGSYCDDWSKWGYRPHNRADVALVVDAAMTSVRLRLVAIGWPVEVTGAALGVG